MPNKTEGISSAVPNESSEVQGAVENKKTPKYKTQKPPRLVEPTPRRYQPDRDFSELAVNEHNRYEKPSFKVGHAIIREDEYGNLVADQYDIIQQKKDLATTVRPLINVKKLKDKFGNEKYYAETPTTHTPMVGTRINNFKEGPDQDNLEEGFIVYFSPVTTKSNYGNINDIDKEWPVFTDKKVCERCGNDKKNSNKTSKDSAARCSMCNAPVVMKGGKTHQIIGEDIALRDQIKYRKPDQNTVMGHSAVAETADFLAHFRNKLHPKIIEKLDKISKVKVGSRIRSEWLHALGFSLTQMKNDPQVCENLGSASFWANTEMMILERIAKWFALNNPDLLVHTQPIFEMFLNTDQIRRIYHNVTLQSDSRFLQFERFINPMALYPRYRKSTDLAQAVAIADKLLAQEVPNSRQIINNQGGTMPTRSVTSKSSKDIDVMELCKNSVLKAKNRSKTHDYSRPWASPNFSAWSGSAFVLRYEGKNFIVSNAHVATNSAHLSLRFPDDHKYYEARVLALNHVSDLALLTIDDETFWKRAVSFELGDTARMRDKITVAGYPMGGEEISITDGKITRTEVGSYCHSGINLYHQQTDAAVNPGNSGGPALQENKVVGVAFQGDSSGDGLNYIIPKVILEHFLKDYLKHGNSGFPHISIECQSLINPTLREYFGMRGARSGVRVVNIDPLSSAEGILQIDDIILSIDGVSISNDGMVRLPELGERVNFHHLINRKFIGDDISVRILRSKHEKVVKIKLNEIHRSTKKVGLEEYNIKPRYRIFNLLCVQPHTQNYEDEVFHGGLLPYVEKPKKRESDEVLVVTHIFAHETTADYENFQDSVIRSVNGKKVHNMVELANEIEKCSESRIVVEFKSRKIIVLPNFSDEDHMKILREQGVDNDRSHHYRDVSDDESEDTVATDDEIDQDDIKAIARNLVKNMFAGKIPASDAATSAVTPAGKGVVRFRRPAPAAAAAVDEDYGKNQKRSRHFDDPDLRKHFSRDYASDSESDAETIDSSSSEEVRRPLPTKRRRKNT